MKGIITTLILSAFVLSGCRSTQDTCNIERTKSDTIYMNKVQTDSLIINRYRYIDRRNDTLLIHDTLSVYRSHLLHDTIRIHQVDTIPVVKHVEVIKEVKYTPWYMKVLAVIGGIALSVESLAFSVKRFR